MTYLLDFIIDFGMSVGGTILLLSAIFLPIYGHLITKISAFSMGMTCILLFLRCNISVRRFDKKYKKKLLAHKKAKYLVLVSFFLSPETAIQLKWHRMPVYLFRYRKKDPKYHIRKEILPEYSYNEITKIDKIILYAFVFFGLVFFITGIISLIKGYI